MKKISVLFSPAGLLIFISIGLAAAACELRSNPQSIGDEDFGEE